MDNIHVVKETTLRVEKKPLSLTKKQVKPKNIPVAHHLLFCNHSAYGDFSILKRENKLELKDSLLIMRDKPYLNKKITSAPLYLFDSP